MGPGCPDEPLGPGRKKSRRPPITPVPKKRSQLGAPPPPPPSLSPQHLRPTARSQHPTWTDAPAVHPAQLSRQRAFRPARRQAESPPCTSVSRSRWSPRAQ